MGSVMKDPWPCKCIAETTNWSGKKLHVEFDYDGSGDMVGIGMQLFKKRIRKPRLWYGVEIQFVSPLGQVDYQIYEE